MELQELIELKNWWFDNNNVWFNSSEYDDMIITNKFEHQLEHNFDFDFDILHKNKELGIGYIILHDQITRHIKRSKNYSEDYILNNLTKINDFVEIFYNKHKNDLLANEFCFVLLPLRHSNIFEKQLFVMNETWNKISANNTDIQIYKNYLKATYERACKGKIYKINELKINTKEKYNTNTNILSFTNDYKDILDISCHNYLKIIDKIDFKDNINIENIENIAKVLKNNKKYILSISGGVDSIVLSYILKKMSINFKIVHINYANRGLICEQEKELLYNWSNFLDIELFVRDIYEINRSKCMKNELRDLYENYTRDVRYQTYIDVAKLYDWNNSEWSVLLGHNYDDCIENILTNITNKTKYDNLFGMENESLIMYKNQQIHFTRPMLNIKKISIYNYANYYNIPYFVDSTPKWSQRGIIRDIICPAFIHFNKNSLNGLEELAKIMKESIECVDMLVDCWINNLIPLDKLDKKIVNIPLLNLSKITNIITIKIEISKMNFNKIFWSRLLEKIYLININSKTIDEIINRLEITKKKFDVMQIKKLIQIQINKNNRIYCWKIKDNIIIGFSGNIRNFMKF